MTTIHVTASRDYDVLVQPGLLDDAGAQIARVLGTGRTAAIVAGATVAGLYAERLSASLTRAGFRTVTFTYPGGEHCKTLATYAALLVTLDPLQTDADTLIPALRRLWDALPPVSSTAAGRLVEVPVCYGGDYGPDLAFVAQHAGLFVCQQDVFVLVDDVEPRRRDLEPGILLRGSFKKLVVDV